MPAEILEDPSFTVARYRQVDACEGFTAGQLSKKQLPEGFPFLVDRTSGSIVEPVFRYLFRRAVKTNRVRISTAVAIVDNLRLWWGYLQYRGIDWSKVTSADIESYRRGLCRVISTRTGAQIAEGTLRQRMTHVLAFYRWANENGYSSINPDFLNDRDNSSGGRELAARIHAFTYEEWTQLRPLIGPLPTDDDYDPVTRPSRDRLTWELMLNCGMRRMEVCAITVQQIRSLLNALSHSHDDFECMAIRLTMVKGGPKRARNALIPVWLIRNLGAYLNGPERVAAAQAYAAAHEGREPHHLFLNHAHSKRAPGSPLQPHRVDAVFTEIMRAAGMVSNTIGINPASGDPFNREVPLHCVHDLRHTAAVWRYMAERAAGNPTPWVDVQILLGHKDVETTRRVYLQVTNLFEALVSDAALNVFRYTAGNVTQGGSGAVAF